MSKKIIILDMFYNKHLKPTDIALELNVSTAYITKVIKNDSRYVDEKESRKCDNKIARQIYLYNYQKKYRAYKKDDVLIGVMKRQHIQAVYELSYKPHISTQNLRKSCSSVYVYNSKTNKFHVNKGICVPNDMPRVIDMNKKIMPKERSRGII